MGLFEDGGETGGGWSKRMAHPAGSHAVERRSRDFSRIGVLGGTAWLMHLEVALNWSVMSWKNSTGHWTLGAPLGFALFRRDCSIPASCELELDRRGDAEAGR